ncbi:uncharacterized protein LOC124642702, partial [Helicoverpa zea]|uniref:uncharacterized protein LOC124642702 n=1 Tax=Helicoverpa zea TaxID=7113 RepID=UPI001F5751A2
MLHLKSPPKLWHLFRPDTAKETKKVYRRKGERFAQSCFEERVAYGGGSRTVWGGISASGKTQLEVVTGPRLPTLNAERYIRECLGPHVIPYADYVGPNFLFMHDNARTHAAGIVREYLRDVNITVMDWSARSPDMNPIEHMWDELKRRVRARQPVAQTMQESKTAIEEEWEMIPQNFIERLINSMPNRMRAVGDKTQLKNYRPISLLSHVYKLFSRVITNRLARRLDEFQPPEQAGFRSGYGTIDHIHTVRQIIQKTEEPIPLHRGVRQGDVISPKLFTNAMEDMFKTLNWKGRGININGEHISHLRFADDIVIMAETLQDLQQMLNDLAESSLRIGLRMNLDKTKVMFNEHVLPEPIAIHGAVLEVVRKYVYLGQTLQLGRNNFEDEVNRRIQLGWAAFGKLRRVLTSSIPQCLKTKVFNQCVLPVMTYGAETWTLSVRLVHKFKVAQRAMERAMLGISLRDRIRNEVIRQRTKVID